MFGVDGEMDIKFPKAGSVRPFELRVRPLHTLTSFNLQSSCHFSCKVYMEICMRGSTMHLLKNPWQFSFKITAKATHISFEKPQFTCETHYVCQGYALLVYSAFMWPVLKIELGIVLSNSFRLPLY